MMKVQKVEVHSATILTMYMPMLFMSVELCSPFGALQSMPDPQVVQPDEAC